MIILLIIGIVLSGLAIGSLARATAWPRGGLARSAGVPRRVREYGFTKREQSEETSGGVREKLDEVATKLGTAVGGGSRGRGDLLVRKDLISAGLYNVTPGRFLGYRLLCAAAFPILLLSLGEELQLTLPEQNMGLSNQEALLNMLSRCDTASMRSFVRSIVHGETLGVSIGQIMRDLAQEMRRRRRAVAQEKAQKAPIKILFPLVLLIFPAMFVILLGPALFMFFRAFSGGI